MPSENEKWLLVVGVLGYMYLSSQAPQTAFVGGFGSGVIGAVGDALEEEIEAEPPEFVEPTPTPGVPIPDVPEIPPAPPAPVFGPTTPPAPVGNPTVPVMPPVAPFEPINPSINPDPDFSNPDPFDEEAEDDTGAPTSPGDFSNPDPFDEEADDDPGGPPSAPDPFDEEAEDEPATTPDPFDEEAEDDNGDDDDDDDDDADFGIDDDNPE